MHSCTVHSRKVNHYFLEKKKKKKKKKKEEGNVNCETQTRNNVGHFRVKSHAKCFGIKCPYFASAPFQF